MVSGMGLMPHPNSTKKSMSLPDGWSLRGPTISNGSRGPGRDWFGDWSVSRCTRQGFAGFEHGTSHPNSDGVTQMEANSRRLGDASTDRSSVFVVLLAIIVAGIGQSFIFAVLPPVGRAMAISDIQISLIITTSSMLFVFSTPLWGRLIEAWGRRPAIVFGLAASGVTTALFGLVILLRLEFLISGGLAFVLLVALRALYAVGSGGVLPAAQAFFADRSTPTRRAASMGTFGFAFGLGLVAGPAAGGALVAVGYAAPSFGVAALVVIIAALVAAVLHPTSKRTEAENRIDQPFAMQSFLPFLVMCVLHLMTFASVQQVAAFRLQDLLGLTTAETAEGASLALITMATAFITTQSILVPRIKGPPILLVRIGAPVGLVALAVMSLSHSLLSLSIGMAAYGVALGLIGPGYLAAASLAAGAQQQGRIAGFLTAAQAAGIVLGPPIATTLYQLDPVMPYWMGMVLTAVVGLIACLQPSTAGRAEASASAAGRVAGRS